MPDVTRWERKFGPTPLARPAGRRGVAVVLVAGSVAWAMAATPGRVARSDLPPGASAARSAAPGPVVVVGIDGASWEFIDSLIGRGDLPNLARVRRKSARARLRSVDCFVSPPAWVSMLSGYLPDKTGVYSFGRVDPDLREFVGVDARDVRVPRVWDVASRAGRRVGVFNVPMTFPPERVNGAMVSGMMTPTGKGDPVSTRRSARRPILPPGGTPVVSYAPAMRSVVEDSLNVYVWSLYDTVDDARRRHDRVVLAVAPKFTAAASDSGHPDGATRGVPGADTRAVPAEQPRFYAFDVGAVSPWIRVRTAVDGFARDGWCKAIIRSGSDNRYVTELSSVFFEPDVSYAWPAAFAAELRDTFGCYIPDRFAESELLADFAEEAARHAAYFYDRDDWDLFLYVFRESDTAHHLTGFSPVAARVYRAIDGFVGRVIRSLPPGGILFVVSDHGFARYRYGVDLNRCLETAGLLVTRSDGTVDRDASLVYHHIWHLYFNRALATPAELSRRGIGMTPGQDPLDALETAVRSAVAGLPSPGGRTTIDVGMKRLTPPAAAGAAAAGTPDMRVEGARGDWTVDFLGSGRVHEQAVRALKDVERWWHSRDGVLMAWGNGVKSGVDLGVCDIQDVAPTLLYRMGIPVARGMDGRIVLEAFDDPPPPLWTGAHDDAAQRGSGRDTTAAPRREALAKKLRSLGYVR